MRWSDRSERLKGKGLAAHEIKVVKLIASGLCNKDIAREAGLSLGTTKFYVSAAMAKLGFESRTQMAVWYLTVYGVTGPNPRT